NQWSNFAPCLGLAWDEKGDGTLSVRASYARGCEFVSGVWRDTYNGHAPFAHRLTLQSPQGGLGTPFVGVPVWNPFPYVLDGYTQIYHGMLLSVQRRAAKGVTVSGNYTYSHCIGPYAMFGAMGPHVDDTYVNPYDREFDRGNCDTDRRNIFNLTAVADTPRFS